MQKIHLWNNSNIFISFNSFAFVRSLDFGWISILLQRNAKCFFVTRAKVTIEYGFMYTHDTLHLNVNLCAYKCAHVTATEIRHGELKHTLWHPMEYKLENKCKHSRMQPIIIGNITQFALLLLLWSFGTITMCIKMICKSAVFFDIIVAVHQVKRVKSRNVEDEDDDEKLSRNLRIFSQNILFFGCTSLLAHIVSNQWNWNENNVFCIVGWLNFMQITSRAVIVSAGRLHSDGK